MKLYNVITGTVAFGLAACAAYFSVLGIANLVGYNFWQVATMATFLEAGKLICASAAYRYRNLAPLWVRSLFVVFAVGMMFVTSAGIFGFLSGSYQKAAAQRDISQQKIENLESTKSTYQSRIQRLEKDRNRLIEERRKLQDLRSEQGWLSKRGAKRLAQIPAQLSKKDSILSASQDSVLSYKTKITRLSSKNTEDSKLRPIIFIADTMNFPENQAAFYFIAILTFLFDPMAVTLILALSMATDIDEVATEEEEDEIEDNNMSAVRNIGLPTSNPNELYDKNQKEDEYPRSYQETRNKNENEQLEQSDEGFEDWFENASQKSTPSQNTESWDRPLSQ